MRLLGFKRVYFRQIPDGHFGVRDGTWLRHEFSAEVGPRPLLGGPASGAPLRTEGWVRIFAAGARPIGWNASVPSKEIYIYIYIDTSLRIILCLSVFPGGSHPTVCCRHGECGFIGFD